MHTLLSSSAAMLAIATTLWNTVGADDCAQGAQEINGNWYCQPVTTIQYSGFAAGGTYNKIQSMDSTNGVCSSSSFEYSGPLAPLDEEVSLHFRGPLALKQFAVYVPGSSSAAQKAKSRAKAKAKRSNEHAHVHGHAHGHAHFHKKNKKIRQVQEKAENEKRQWPDVWVTAVIDGATVSWINEWHPDQATTAAVQATTAPVQATSAASVGVEPVSSVLSSVAAQATTLITTTLPAVQTPTTVAKHSHKAKTTTSAASATTSDASTGNIGPGTWDQIAYYEASSGVSNGVTFLNHYGGVGSGTFDYVFGNSLSYASSDACTGATASTVMEDITIPSNKEVVIMTDTSCEEEDGCEFYRPGNVAYHGFDGAQKLFLMEFSMPDDGTTGYAMNMPAIWMLNAQIPRTIQYGQADCSCWTSGCGELDLFEVLDSGNTRAKSTFHGNHGGGDSDYFVRPTNGTIKAAVTMNGETATIKVLSDSFEFPSSLTGSTVQQLASNTWSDVEGLVSLFNLGG